MTPRAKLFVVHPTSHIDDALRLIVRHEVRGLPVVDDEETVVGMVTDWDLLNLTDLSGDLERHHFPPLNQNWSAFNELKKRLEKNKGHRIDEIMDEEVTSVREDATLDLAARLLLDNRRRRMPVVDERGKLLGVVSRGDLLKAALMIRRRVKAQSEAPFRSPSPKI